MHTNNLLIRTQPTAVALPRIQMSVMPPRPPPQPRQRTHLSTYVTKCDSTLPTHMQRRRWRWVRKTHPICGDVSILLTLHICCCCAHLATIMSFAANRFFALFCIAFLLALPCYHVVTHTPSYKCVRHVNSEFYSPRIYLMVWYVEFLSIFKAYSNVF